MSAAILFQDNGEINWTKDGFYTIGNIVDLVGKSTKFLKVLSGQDETDLTKFSHLHSLWITI